MVGANSAILAGPEGDSIGYRKTNMFETDKTWAKPGTLLLLAYETQIIDLQGQQATDSRRLRFQIFRPSYKM